MLLCNPIPLCCGMPVRRNNIPLDSVLRPSGMRNQTVWTEKELWKPQRESVPEDSFL